jgi:hypothetical protein
VSFEDPHESPSLLSAPAEDTYRIALELLLSLYFFVYWALCGGFGEVTLHAAEQFITMSESLATGAWVAFFTSTPVVPCCGAASSRRIPEDKINNNKTIFFPILITHENFESGTIQRRME